MEKSGSESVLRTVEPINKARPRHSLQDRCCISTTVFVYLYLCIYVFVLRRMKAINEARARQCSGRTLLGTGQDTDRMEIYMGSSSLGFGEEEKDQSMCVFVSVCLCVCVSVCVSYCKSISRVEAV